MGGNIYNEYFPISAVPLLASKSAEYQDAVITVANRTNKVYRDFLLSDEGQGFNGQVRVVLDVRRNLHWSTLTFEVAMIVICT